MFAPYCKYQGWALACFEAGVTELKKDSFQRQVYECLQKLDRGQFDSFLKFTEWYDRHQRQINYLCSPYWPPEFPKLCKPTLDLTFIEVCDSQHLETAQWLAATFPKLNPRAWNDSAYRTACFRGRLPFVRWLKTTWPEIELLEVDDLDLEWACDSRDLPTMEWIRDHCGPFIPTDITYIYTKMCKYSERYTEVCQWLRDNWPDSAYYDP